MDPAKRHVARELEARWNGALERVSQLEQKRGELRAAAATKPTIDRAQLFKLAHDLPAAWNAPSTDTGTKQRLIHILVQEIVCDLDATANEAVLLIHWTGGRHTEVRVPGVKTGRYPGDIAPSAVDALRKLAGHWPDRELAVSLNRMRCKTGNGRTGGIGLQRRRDLVRIERLTTWPFAACTSAAIPSLVRSAISRPSKWAIAPKHVEHQLASGRGGVDLLLQADQVDAAGAEEVDRRQQFAEGAPESVERRTTASASPFRT